jgi:hypothetical protein
MSYAFYCSKCKFDHAGECALKPICETCPAGFCHGKLHHDWRKQDHPMIDLWNTFVCSQCKRTIKRSAMEIAVNTPTERWAGPCKIP